VKMALHNDVGMAGERWVAEHLRQVGQVVHGKVADLRLADCVEIEVKTALPSRPSKKNRHQTYQFCIQRDGRRGLRAPVLVCVCIDPNRWTTTAFVIPAREVVEGGIKKVRIPRDVDGYAGRWAAYREAWAMIADVITGGNYDAG
jgi:hypothetical protein